MLVEPNLQLIIAYLADYWSQDGYGKFWSARSKSSFYDEFEVDKVAVEECACMSGTSGDMFTIWSPTPQPLPSTDANIQVLSCFSPRETGYSIRF
jgi:hypothetical protein